MRVLQLLGDLKMPSLDLLLLFALFQVRVMSLGEPLELTVNSRTENEVDLRCRVRDGGLPSNPVFRTTSGTVLRGEVEATEPAGLRVNITEHSSVLCEDADAQLSNILRIPVYPSSIPPVVEVYVLQGVPKVLECINSIPEEFTDLYSFNQWIRIYFRLDAFLQESFSFDEGLDRVSVNRETFDLTLRVEDEIEDGDSYRCQLEVVQWASSDGGRGSTRIVSGANMTIKIADPLQISGGFPDTVHSLLGEAVNFSCNATGTNATVHWEVNNDVFTDCSNATFCVNSQMLGESQWETMLTVDTTSVPQDTVLMVECVGIQVLNNVDYTTDSTITLFTVSVVRLTAGNRTSNDIQLTCRRSDGESLLPLSPVFKTSSGSEIQGDVIGEGEIVVNIINHTTVLCEAGDQRSNIIFLPVFPARPPPPDEVSVLQTGTAELPCTIDPPSPENFSNLYSIDHWVRDPGNGAQLQLLTPESLPSGGHRIIDETTYSLFIRGGEGIETGDSYKCIFSIREWESDGEVGDNVQFEGQNITIITETVAETEPTSETNTSGTDVAVAAGVALGVLTFILMTLVIPVAICLLCKRKKKENTNAEVPHREPEAVFQLQTGLNPAYSLHSLNELATSAETSFPTRRRLPTYETVKGTYRESVHIYDEPRFNDHVKRHIVSHQPSQESWHHKETSGSCQNPDLHADGNSLVGESGQHQLDTETAGLEPPDSDGQTPNLVNPSHDYEKAQSYEKPDGIQEYERADSCEQFPEHKQLHCDEKRRQQLLDYEQPEGYERIQDYERAESYEQFPENKQLDKLQQQLQDYEQPECYEKVQEQSYERVQEYEQLSSYERVSNYEKVQEYEQISGYEKVQEYEQISSYEKVQEYEQLNTKSWNNARGSPSVESPFKQSTSLVQLPERQSQSNPPDDDYEDIQGYEKPCDYERLQNYARSDSYRQNQDYECLGWW